MPYLKFVALLLLVIVLGVPANSAGPDGPSQSEDAPKRQNLEYLAPEARSVFGPDTYLAAPPFHRADPIEDPSDECKNQCDLARRNGEASCRMEHVLNGDEYGFSLTDCLRDLEQRLYGCEESCGSGRIPA